MVNRTAPEFFNDMKQDLAIVVRMLKEFIHNDDNPNIRVMDPLDGAETPSASPVVATGGEHES
jgi:hypothetical protein